APNDSRFHDPIYTVASTTVQTDNGWLRAYVGSGDRAHVRSTGGGDCRPDDPLTCIDAGCTVTSTTTLDDGSNHYVSTFGSGAGTSASSPVLATPTLTQTTVSSNACNFASATSNVVVSACPTTAMNFTENLT